MDAGSSKRKTMLWLTGCIVFASIAVWWGSPRPNQEVVVYNVLDVPRLNVNEPGALEQARAFVNHSLPFIVTNMERHFPVEGAASDDDAVRERVLATIIEDCATWPNIVRDNRRKFMNTRFPLGRLFMNPIVWAGLGHTIDDFVEMTSATLGNFEADLRNFDFFDLEKIEGPLRPNFLTKALIASPLFKVTHDIVLVAAAEDDNNNMYGAGQACTPWLEFSSFLKQQIDDFTGLDYIKPGLLMGWVPESKLIFNHYHMKVKDHEHPYGWNYMHSGSKEWVLVERGRSDEMGRDKVVCTLIADEGESQCFQLFEQNPLEPNSVFLTTQDEDRAKVNAALEKTGAQQPTIIDAHHTVIKAGEALIWDHSMIHDVRNHEGGFSTSASKFGSAVAGKPNTPVEEW